MMERDPFRRSDRRFRFPLSGRAIASLILLQLVLWRAFAADSPLPTAAPSADSESVANSEAPFPAIPGPVVEISPGIKAQLLSSDVPEGGVIRVRISVAAGAKMSAFAVEFEGTHAEAFADPDGEFGLAVLLGVPHGHKPGKSEVIAHLGDGKDARKISLPLSVRDAGFPLEHLKVEAKHVNPPKKEMERIQREQSEIGRIYRQLTLEKLWKGPFVLPIESKVMSPYGTRRLYNGEERNYHGGLDLKAAIGTPIHAAASGRIVLAKDLYFTGNTVMIDHGYGLISLYAHMSKLRVKKGQAVKQGEGLGLSGKTGRVTGPHLH